jgi:spermidine/putrescine transport system substrate-binding protein
MKSARPDRLQGNLKFFWDNKDQLNNGLRTDEIVGAMMWDTGGWKLNSEKAEIQFIAPKSGALGWIDTFAIPGQGQERRCGLRLDQLQHAPRNRRQGGRIGRQLHRVQGRGPAGMDAKLKAQFAASFPTAALNNVKWYPAVPAGLEDIEGQGARPHQGGQLSARVPHPCRSGSAA